MSICKSFDSFVVKWIVVLIFSFLRKTCDYMGKLHVILCIFFSLTSFCWKVPVTYGINRFSKSFEPHPRLEPKFCPWLQASNYGHKISTFLILQGLISSWAFGEKSDTKLQIPNWLVSILLEYLNRNKTITGRFM